jgi:polyferredoxin/heme/copper-type cytochrome/quinol oxidase subunit 2
MYRVTTMLLTFATLLLLAMGSNADSSGRDRIDPASISFLDVQGQKVSLKDMKEHPLLLLLSDTNESSKAALSNLAELIDYYSASELHIIPFSVNKNTTEAQALAEELWLTAPLYGDPQNQISAAFGIKQFPWVIILDNAFNVRYNAAYVSNDVLKKELFGIMKEKVFFLTARKFYYTPNILDVHKGDDVLIKMISEDVEHGLFIDGYEKYVSQYLDRDGKPIPVEKASHFIKPGELGLLRFHADKAGRFSFRCACTCGEFHPYMIGQLRVGPNVLFPIGSVLVSLLAIIFIIFAYRKDESPAQTLFGLVPLSWKFELTQFKAVRALLKSRWFPLLPILFNMAMFTIILFSAYVGGLGGAGNYNLAVMIVWILWWVLLMLIMVPFIGRFWCMICPFPLLGDWIQRGKLLLVGRQKSFGLRKRWPNKWRNLWPLVVLFYICTWFSGFFTVRPMATFILLVTIIGLSIIIAIIFEKRTFCLFVCPVSGFQGLYANFSMCEIRAIDPEICKNHQHKTCVVGNENGYGCPWMELPYDMNRNTYCGMCMECFKTCPYDNMALNIRPLGKDLVAPRRRTDEIYHRRGLDEAFKALTMIGIFFSFFIVFQEPYGAIKDMARATTLKGFLLYIADLSLTDFLLVPGVFLLFCLLAKVLSRDKNISLTTVFTNFSACLIPLGLAIWAAFSIGIIFPNGSYLLHVLSDPFAWGWDLFGTAHCAWTPWLTAVPPYLQLAIIVVGLLFALDYGFKLSLQTFTSLAAAKRGWIPMSLCLSALSVFFIWLFVG